MALTLKMEKLLNHDYKNNNGPNFQFTKFSFIDFVLTDRLSLSGKRAKSASGKSSSCRFSFSAARNANTKATEYVIFGFSFCDLTEWRQRRVTCQQLIGNINTRKKIRFFFTCVVTAFLRAGNPC